MRFYSNLCPEIIVLYHIKCLLTMSKLILVCLSVTILLSCKGEEVLVACDDPEFCNFITAEAFDKAAPVINQYLASQKSSLSSDQKLDDLKSWLECKTCVSSAELICNSCIYTLPAQSEISVRFSVNGKDTVRIMDIEMSNPLKFVIFH